VYVHVMCVCVCGGGGGVGVYVGGRAKTRDMVVPPPRAQWRGVFLSVSEAAAVGKGGQFWGTPDP